VERGERYELQSLITCSWWVAMLEFDRRIWFWASFTNLGR
jgi:hypothetical protein